MSTQTHGWIRVRGVRIEDARVGVHPHERDRPQPVVVDVALWAHVARAAETDKITDTIDYGKIAATVVEVTTSRHFNLVEALCEALARALLGRFGVERVQVEVQKPGGLGVGLVSIAVERSQ